MDRKAEAAIVRRSAESMIVTAQKLIAYADKLDPPARMFMPDRSDICTCDACGLGISGLQWDGVTCDAIPRDRVPCPGTFRAPAPVKSRRTICRACGTEYAGAEYFPGCACETQGCEGFLKRKDDEPTVIDGTRLAFEAALMTFLEDDPDNDDDFPGIASTYRERRG